MADDSPFSRFFRTLKSQSLGLSEAIAVEVGRRVQIEVSLLGPAYMIYAPAQVTIHVRLPTWHEWRPEPISGSIFQPSIPECERSLVVRHREQSLMLALSDRGYHLWSGNQFAYRYARLKERQLGYFGGSQQVIFIQRMLYSLYLRIIRRIRHNGWVVSPAVTPAPPRTTPR